VTPRSRRFFYGRKRSRARGVANIAAAGFFCFMAIGCSLKIGEWGSVCFLDHANLELTVQHPHGDPNGPQD